MPHHVLDKSVLTNLDKDISNHLEIIRAAQQYQQELERPAIRQFVDNLKSLLTSLRYEKDAFLIEGTDQAIRNATLILGKELLTKEIVQSFEADENFLNFHRKKVQELEKQREQYKSNGDTRADD